MEERRAEGELVEGGANMSTHVHACMGFSKNKEYVFLKGDKCCLAPLIEVPRVTNSAKAKATWRTIWESVSTTMCCHFSRWKVLEIIYYLILQNT